MEQNEKFERVCENCSLLKNRSERMSYLFGIQTQELANIFCESAPETVRLAYKEIFGEKYSGKIFAELCREYYTARKASENVIASDIQTFLHIYGTEDSTTDAKTISYMRNIYSDSAYRRFTQGDTSFIAISVQTFSEACEEVYYGRCRWCILPIRNSTDGQLTMFKKLTKRFELRIISVTDILMSDSESFTRFALLGRDIKPDRKQYDYFELTFPIDVSLSLSELFDGLTALDIKIESLNTSPTSYSGSESEMNAVLNIKNCDIYPLLMYFHYALPGNEPLGIYSIV